MSTEMVSSLLNPEVRGNVKIPVEHLDYNYIQNCTDLKYLEKIVAVLRSGEEGMYPHLTDFCEKHIEKLNPRSRALRIQRPPARAADFSLEEWREIMEDVKTWEANVKRSEIELGKLSCMYREETVPPVRGAKVSFPIKQNSGLSPSGTKRRSVLPRDYREWDRFDVEEECSKIDDNTKQNHFPTMINQCLPNIKQRLDTAGLTEKEKIMLANREKAKGNEAFQANDYEEAVAYYTRSVSVMPTAAAYNNRAQAEIKLQQWHNALRDCQEALEMEPNNLKALLRRATVQNHFGDLEAAADDLRKVLQTESQNAAAKKMLQDMEDKVSASAAWNHGRGRRILIEEEEEERDEHTEDKEDEYERVPPAKPSLCAGGESAAAPAAERPDMGNAQKKSPGRAEGAPQGDAGTHRRSKRGSVDLNRTQQPRDKELVNGGRPAAGSCSAHQDSAGAGDSRTGAGACGDSGGRLDAPSGALPPPLARLKNEGNQLFKNGQFGDALEKYSQAISGFLDSGVDSPEDLCILYSNRAACYLKDGNSTDCIQDCTRALELQPFSLKPLLRRAMAHESLERYRMAYVDYKTVLQIDVGVQAAHDSIHRITKLLIEQDGPNWREKLPEIPLVPLSAQQHRREEPPSAELQQARAARAAEEAARKAEVRFLSLKQQGNDCVKKGQFEEALTHYSECVKLKPDECAIYTNRALCYLKVERFAQAKEDCDSALQLESSNKKAFYRRAMAYKGLKDYLACSSDLQEVLHLDPNVQEAERELEEVTVLLRQSLAAGSPNKPRRNVPISEVDGSDEEDAMNKNSNNNHGSSQSAAKHSKSTPLHPSNAYEFSQAMNSAHSQDDVAAAAEILRNTEPETLPLYVSNQLDGDSMHFLTRALEHLLQQDPILVFQHLNHLHKADRFSMVLMLLGQSERSQITSLLERLSAVESKGFTANDVQNLANKYI